MSTLERIKRDLILTTSFLLALCNCIPQGLQPHPPVRRLLEPALRMLVQLRHRIPGWLQLLDESILLLGVFRRREQLVGCRANAHRCKELEEDVRIISS